MDNLETHDDQFNDDLFNQIYLEDENEKTQPTENSLEQNLNTILDNFQSIVGSGMTTSVYTNYLMFHLGSHEDVVDDIDIQSDFDGLYPINPWKEQKNYVGNKDRRSKEILMETPVSDTDKELLKEWFLSGGDVKNYQYGVDLHPYRNRFKMDRITWWRFTKGLLWKFYNYLLVNLKDKNLETIDEELSMVLMEMIFDLTSKNGERNIQDDLYEIGLRNPDNKYFKRNGSPEIPYQYKTLQEWYGDPKTNKLEREIKKLKNELEGKEWKLEMIKKGWIHPYVCNLNK